MNPTELRKVASGGIPVVKKMISSVRSLDIIKRMAHNEEHDIRNQMDTLIDVLTKIYKYNHPDKKSPKYMRNEFTLKKCEHILDNLSELSQMPKPERQIGTFVNAGLKHKIIQLKKNIPKQILVKQVNKDVYKKANKTFMEASKLHDKICECMLSLQLLEREGHTHSQIQLQDMINDDIDDIRIILNNTINDINLLSSVSMQTIKKSSKGSYDRKSVSNILRVIEDYLTYAKKKINVDNDLDF